MRSDFFKFQRLRIQWRVARTVAGLGALCLLAPVGLRAQDPGSAAVTPPVAVPAGLPLLGDGSDMSVAAERRLGERIARELYRDPDYVDDPVLAEYVQGVWQPLLAAARLRGDLTPELDERFAWQVLLRRDRTVNAFALPGGYMGVHLGLIAVVNSRDELASVLGHELSHITQRHIARLTSRSSQQAPWLLGAMILGALAASKNADTGNALIVGGQALSAQSQLNFSRDMEREADRMGYGVMTQAGFKPQGFVTMFDKLQQASQLNDTGAYPYLRSHPLTTERIADMQSRLPLGAPHPVEAPPTLLSAMMSARARFLANPDADSLRGWQAQVDDAAFAARPSAQRVATLYGAVLAAGRLRDGALAQVDLQRLQALTAGQPGAAQQVRWLAAEVALAAGELSQPQALTAALGLTRETGAPAALRRPELLLQAQLAVQASELGLLTRVASNLQGWLASHPQDGLAWQWMARVEAAQHQDLRALRAEAEVQVAHLDYSAALDRLKAAQDRLRQDGMGNTPAEHIDASIIDVRRRQIQALLKQQTLDH